jgi:hypothetical protein
MNTYPGEYVTGANWTGLSGLVWPTNTSSSYGLYEPGTGKSNRWWFGAYLDGKAGPVNITLDFVYDYGKVQQKNMINSDGTGNSFYAPDVDYSGWVTRAKLDFPWEKFNFGVVGMYATGADANKTSINGMPGSLVANPSYAAKGVITKRVSSYMVPPASESSPGAQESIVMYSCFNAVADGGTGIANVSSYYNMSRGGFGGTAFLKGYGSVKAAPWYKITLQGLYVWDTTKHGNTFGTARKPDGLTLKDDNGIGFELDLIQEIDIYKNLKGFIGLGYLWGGSGLDVWNSSLSRNFSPKDPWNFTTRLLYTF